MSDNMRWRYGDTNPVVISVDTASTIEIGDFLYLESGKVKPASAQADAGTKSDNQIAFHSTFAGVAMQRSPAGDANPIRVATTGVFQYDCAAHTFAVGDLIAIDEAASGTQLANQVVAPGSGYDHSIGHCVKATVTNATAVLVDLVSTALKGGLVVPA